MNTKIAYLPRNVTYYFVLDSLTVLFADDY